MQKMKAPAVPTLGNHSRGLHLPQKKTHDLTVAKMEDEEYNWPLPGIPGDAVISNARPLVNSAPSKTNYIKHFFCSAHNFYPSNLFWNINAKIKIKAIKSCSFWKWMNLKMKHVAWKIGGKDNSNQIRMRKCKIKNLGTEVTWWRTL